MAYIFQLPRGLASTITSTLGLLQAEQGSPFILGDTRVSEYLTTKNEPL